MKRYYEISVEALTKDVIYKANNTQKLYPDRNYLITIPNTIGIELEELKKLNDNIHIRVKGAYTDELVERKKDRDYYRTSVVYSKNELVQIMSEIEKIESKFKEQNFSDKAKFVYIYLALRKLINYDPKFKEKSSDEIRTLRGLISKRTVCAGYAVILKELLDRQGIKCEYVEGKSINSSHAWNYVTLDGKTYGVDLTWENNKFRSGKMDELNWIASDVDEFKKVHIPFKDDPNKDTILSKLDENEVKKIMKRLNMRIREFDETVHIRNRNDGSMYIIAQTGMMQNSINRYIYADILDNGTVSAPKIIFSESNLSLFLYGKDWSKISEKGIKNYENLLDNVLFSKENINDSLRQGTGYIGKLEKGLPNEKRGFVKDTHEIEKANDKMKQYTFTLKSLTRSDGSKFTIQKGRGYKSDEGTTVTMYDIYEFLDDIDGNRKLVIDRVYSEQDLTKDYGQDFIDEFLSRERLDRKKNEAGSYLGYYEDGWRVSNKRFANYFKRRYNEYIRFGENEGTKSVKKLQEETKKEQENIVDLDKSESVKSSIMQKSKENLRKQLN